MILNRIIVEKEEKEENWKEVIWFILKGKKPIHAPVRIAVMRAISGSDFSTVKISRHTADMVETPQARPSRPSIRFIAFVRRTIHITVMG